MIGEDEVHVWQARLDAPAPRIDALRDTLSPDERERAARFRFERDRERFIVARGLLRRLLGEYLDLSPEQIRFGYGPRGKPFLAEPDDTLRFNLSHAGQIVLYALTRRRRIGIDIEHVRPVAALDTLCRHWLSPRENAMLSDLGDEARLLGFFNCWTRKEAYVKARGDGLDHPLDRFTVSLLPGEPARLLAVQDDPDESARWSLQALTPAPDYVAALAVEGQGWDLRCRHWDW